jgi:G3E family GTPase
MDLQEFTLTTSRETPPAGLNPVLEALWHVRKGDWARAHSIVQEHEGDRAYAVVHAHLHRIEGDLANASYWYSRAGRKAADGALEEEWNSLVARCLQQTKP